MSTQHFSRLGSMQFPKPNPHEHHSGTSTPVSPLLSVAARRLRAPRDRGDGAHLLQATGTRWVEGEKSCGGKRDPKVASHFGANPTRRPAAPRGSTLAPANHTWERSPASPGRCHVWFAGGSFDARDARTRRTPPPSTLKSVPVTGLDVCRARELELGRISAGPSSLEGPKIALRAAPLPVLLVRSTPNLQDPCLLLADTSWPTSSRIQEG